MGRVTTDADHDEERASEEAKNDPLNQCDSVSFHVVIITDHPSERYGVFTPFCTRLNPNTAVQKPWMTRMARIKLVCAARKRSFRTHSAG